MRHILRQHVSDMHVQRHMPSISVPPIRFSRAHPLGRSNTKMAAAVSPRGLRLLCLYFVLCLVGRMSALSPAMTVLPKLSALAPAARGRGLWSNPANAVSSRGFPRGSALGGAYRKSGICGTVRMSSADTPELPGESKGLGGSPDRQTFESRLQGWCDRCTMAFPVWVLSAAVQGLVRPASFAWTSSSLITIALAITMVSDGSEVCSVSCYPSSVETENPSLWPQSWSSPTIVHDSAIVS